MLLLLALLPDAHAACALSVPAPTSTLTASTSFTFLATTDCVSTSFQVIGFAGTITPTSAGVVAGKNKWSVTPTAAQWSLWTGSSKTTLQWKATGTPASGPAVTLTTTNQLDLDSDGYTRTAGDTGSCDATSTVNPGVAETCDGVDNNCNGSTDEGVKPTWYADGDHDGYGAGAGTASCTAPSGSVATNTDCNDASASVNPAATEVCNGVDDECDGLVDTADASLTATPLYVDADADGYGSTAVADVCSPPSGATATSGDCDDGHATAHPGGTEICDGLDNDCDGLSDAADGTLVATAYYTDGDHDGYGNAAVADRCNPGGDASTAAGDCDDVDWNVHPGQAEFCDDVDDDCDGTVGDAGLVSVGNVNYGTIQAAIDAADPGETVSICAGTWREALAVTDDIVLDGPQGAEVTILDGGNRRRILHSTGNYSEPSGSVEVHGLTFMRGYGRCSTCSSAGGAIDAMGASALIVDDSVFDRNRGPDYGGAIAVPLHDAAVTMITDSTFTSNQANYGGGAIGRQSPYTGAIEIDVSGSSFARNSSSSQGAAIYAPGYSPYASTNHVVIDDSTFDGDHSNGGAVYVSYGDLVVTDSSFEDAYSAYVGGAISTDTANVSVNGSSFVGNTAYYGGAIYGGGSGAWASVSDSTFTDNVGTGDGGAIDWDGSGGVAIDRCSMTYNGSVSHGGAIRASSGSLTTTASEFAYNDAGDGGAIYVNGGTWTADDVDIHDNFAGSTGGGAYVSSGSTIDLDDTTFRGNEALGAAGGLYAYARTALTLDGVDFDANSASSAGGAYFYGEDTASCAFTGVDVTDNHASVYGGGLELDYFTTCTWSGVDVSGNTANQDAGGVYVQGTNLAASTSAVHGNTATTSGGGLEVYGGSGETLSGLEIYDNTVTNSWGGGLYAYYAALSNLDIHDNTTLYGSAGGLYLSNGTLSGITLTDNWAGGAGGGAYVSAVTWTSGSVSGNYAYDAAGLYADQSSVLSGLTVSDNFAGDNGGGAYLSGANWSGGTISGNSAVVDGGGLYSNSSSNTVTSPTVSGNTAGNRGGGCFVSSGNVGGTYSSNTAYSGGGCAITGGTLNAPTLSSNTSTNGGGGLYSTGGTISSATISGNTAVYGGGVYQNGGGTLSSVNVTGNHASTAGGGIYGWGNTSSCSIKSNDAPNGGGGYITGGNASWTSPTIQNDTATTAGGGVYVATSYRLITTSADFGSGSTDNSPSDVALQLKSLSCTYTTGVSKTFLGSALACP